jgi:CubicO group peptidase (beta-lactamase class C family)
VDPSHTKIEKRAIGAAFSHVGRIRVLFGSKNVTQMVMVMVSARLLAVTNLNRLVSNFSVVSDYGWTKTNMI